MSVRDEVERIYEAERQHIYSYLLFCGVQAGQAQELAQDAFLKLHLTMSKGVVIENPRAWLYRVAHNLALRSHRREALFDELDPNSGPPQEPSDIEGALIDEQRRTRLFRAIRDLSPQQRNCLHLRVQGLRYREIADAIGISTSAVGEFLRRAVHHLKAAVDG
jgi:RNA polymerase sigma-70 factor (ECF subfamily)